MTVRRGGKVAVDNVSFDVGAGEVVALLGPNGAGKTTVMETIQGYLRPSSGTARTFGVDPSTSSTEVAHRWGVMPQNGGLPMGLTVVETLTLFSELHGSNADVNELMALVGLTSVAKRKWRRISGGQQQRLSLAISLCGGTDLLLLDEPTSAVDASGRDQILSLIQERQADGSAVLVTTHRFDDAEQVATRVVMLNHGQLVADDSLDALTTDREHIRFTASAGLNTQGMTDLVGPTTETEPGRYVVDAVPDPERVSLVVQSLSEQGVVAESLEAGRTSLEFRFRELTEPKT